MEGSEAGGSPEPPARVPGVSRTGSAWKKTPSRIFMRSPGLGGASRSRAMPSTLIACSALIASVSARAASFAAAAELALGRALTGGRERRPGGAAGGS